MNLKASPFYKLIYFNEFSATPKYQQLANSILNAIEKRKLQVDDVLPSINDLSSEFDISRDTVEKGYRYLKKMGIIGSVAGKGYFIKTADIERRTKIFLLFNKLSVHKKIIYDSFVSTLGSSATINFHIYNNNFSVFKKLVQNCSEDYDHYVIIPHFLEETENAYEVINTIAKDKLILLDKLVPEVKGTYGAVYEDFEKDIYEALEQSLQHLKKYPTLKLVFPDYTYHPKEILRGFYKFCNDYLFNYHVINDIVSEVIKEETVYISLMEDDLVILIEKVLDSKLELGKQIGVISYNETPIKKIILKGITTISSDFNLMGRKAAELILNKSTEHIAIPFKITLRASL